MFSATYSPDDNKLRLYASSRLDAETYQRVKAAGFKFAPKQDLFVAPMWTPAREDLLLELAGEIGDEDTSLAERAEDRAERFDDYSEKRGVEAERAHAAVSAITDNIPFGQPILVGHHSERRARRDQARIEAGMRRALRLWETSGYWKARAAGAIQAAKYKERPDVRVRRIKGLEADQRKRERDKAEAAGALKLWLSLEKLDDDPDAQLARARLIAGRTIAGHLPVLKEQDGASWWSAYDVLLPDGKRFARCPPRTVAQVLAAARAHYAQITAHCDRWLSHIANRLEYERAMLAEAGGTVADRNGPEKGGACRCWASPQGGWSYIQKVNRISVTVLDNWGNGGRNFTRTIPFDKLQAVMSAADVQAAREAGRLVELNDGCGFLLRNAPVPARPEPAPQEEQAPAFEAIRQRLAAGVQIAAVPQLFPTPPAVAAEMARLAELREGHRVLEPSAGTGNLVQAAVDAEPRCEVFAVEINHDLVFALRRRFPTDKVLAHPADFLNYRDPKVAVFDRIVMNPPFANGADVKHIEHALTLLQPGGRLVALCADGPRQNQRLKPRAATWQPLDTFRDQGTTVRTVLLVIDSPAVAAAAGRAATQQQRSLF